MGGSTARALLGGALVVVTLAVAGGELAAGPAGASREHANEAQLDQPHQRRPAAANRLSPTQTPIALAVDAAQKQNAVTTALRDSIATYVAVRFQADAEIAAQQAAAEAAAAAAAAAASRHRPARRAGSSGGGSAPTRSGGTLACIRAHESDSAGGYSAVNSGSGAGGAYQALPSTWGGYGGYARAEQAPAAVQDQWASEAIAASGTRPWAGSGC